MESKIIKDNTVKITPNTLIKLNDYDVILILNDNNDRGFGTVVYSNDKNWELGHYTEIYEDYSEFHGEIKLTN